MSKFWKPNVQHGELQLIMYCMLENAKRVDHKGS